MNENNEQKSYKEYPYAGDGERWYDYIHNFIFWLNSGWRTKFIPKIIRNFLNLQINNIMRINDFERYNLVDEENQDSKRLKMDISFENKINFPGFWATEFFTPTNIKNLDKVLKNSKMQDPNQKYYSRDSIDKMLENFRNENITGDFTIGNYIRPDSKYFRGSSTVLDLPPEFETILVRGVQINHSITAVVMKFEITDNFKNELNKILHENNNASIKFNGKLLRVSDKRQTKISNVQEFIDKIHESARKWIKKNFKGYFSLNNEKLPIYDFYLTDNSSEVQDDSEKIESVLTSNPHRFTKYKNEDYPSLSYFRNYKKRHYNFFLAETLTLFTELKNNYGEGFISSHGGEKSNALFNLISWDIYSYIVFLSMSNLLESWTKRYSQERDRISETHNKFKVKSLKLIRENLIELSFSISIFYDEFDFYSENLSRNSFQKFSLNYMEDKHLKDIYLNKETLYYQEKMINSLIKMDTNYRNIITSIASVGESIENYKISRLALLVSLVSLIISIVIILPTELWNEVINYISLFLNYSLQIKSV